MSVMPFSLLGPVVTPSERFKSVGKECMGFMSCQSIYPYRYFGAMSLGLLSDNVQ